VLSNTAPSEWRHDRERHVPHVTIIDRAGLEHAITADEGTTLMHAIRDAGIDELLALCGGFCSCATCHVHIAPDWIGRVGPPGADEESLLQSSVHRTPRSRLSCQITLSAAFNGLTGTIAPED